MIDRVRHIVPVALLALLGFAACESGVDPFEEDVDRRFAVYGFLDSAADTQYVRVQALRLAAETPEGLPQGVTVRSEAAGVPWEPVVGVDPTGKPVYGFKAGFRPEPGEPYDLVVEREGVQGALGNTVVPPVPGVAAAPGEGDTVSFTKDITLTGLGALEGEMVVWYEVDDPISGRAVRLDIAYTFPRPGDERTFTVYLTLDRAEILRRLGLSPANRTVRLLATGVHVVLRSAEWKSSDLDPGLTDGHGFFGSVGRYDVSWRLPESEVRIMGLVDAQRI